MLQLAAVTYNSTSEALHADRDAPFDDFVMVPPADRATRTQTQPTVWHVSKQDAMVIALAELNRNEPGALHPLDDCEGPPRASRTLPSCGRDAAPPRPAATCAPTNCVKNVLVENYRIAAGDQSPPCPSLFSALGAGAFKLSRIVPVLGKAKRTPAVRN